MVKETKKTNKSTKKNVKTKTVSKTKKNTKKVEIKKTKVGMFKKLSNWIKSVVKEVSKVKWPSKKEMIKYSIATIGFVIFFALFFYVIELLMAFFKSLV
ncbi:MAG: preprotein translocase subunit SecE [Bacilli bacterium]|nr:preprotein translocase subunit SecE [Bacilli bacterium]